MGTQNIADGGFSVSQNHWDVLNIPADDLVENTCWYSDWLEQ